MTGDAYAMGRSEAETERLIRQSGLYAPFTWRLFEQVGLGPGMRVLDVGTGAGDVALMAAEMVGTTGSVVGVDHNPKVLQTARARAIRAGVTNATFVEGDAGALELDGGFDAAVGRLVLTTSRLKSLSGRSISRRWVGRFVVVRFSWQGFNAQQLEP
jgi:protein-L-isoaspartate O-methyltransferase